jgi:pheromone shutdown protein TraB
MEISIPYRNVAIMVVVSILVGIIGLFNAEVMDTVSNQLRPVLVFMSLTFTLLFTKFSSQNTEGIQISRDNMKEDIKKTSDELITFIKKDSKLFDFLVFNSALFFIIIMHVVISKYVEMDKKYIDLIQQAFTLVCFFILLGFYHSTSSDTKFTYIIVCVIVFYMFRIFHKIDQIAKIGISTKLIDLSALEYDNVDFLKYVQMIFNGLFLIKFFS